MTQHMSSGGAGRRGPHLAVALRYVFRQGWVWLCLIAVAAGNTAVMLDRGAPWRGDLVWTIDWLPISLILVGPLISGFVAVDTARLAVGVQALPLPRGRTFDLAVAITYGLALAGLHVGYSLVTVAVSRPPVIDPAAPLAVLAQVAMLIFFVALGSLIGRFAPVVLGGLGAALAALLCVYLFSAPGSPVGLLYAGAATTPRIGYRYNATWLLVQIVALVVVALASWVVRPGAHRSRLRVLATGVTAVVLTIGAGAAVQAVPGDRLEADGAVPDACGSLAGVPWCYYPQHERVAGLYADNLLLLFEVATSQGYPDLVPQRVLEADQRTWPTSATTGVFYVTPEALAGQRPDLWETALRLIEPAHCTQLAGELPPAERYWEDLTALTGTWVGLVDPSLAEQNGYFGEPMTPEEAGHVMAGFRDCTYPFEG